MAADNKPAIDTTDAAARPSPTIEPHSAPFYEAAHQGTLVLPHCPTCQRYNDLGARTCMWCWGSALEWREASGKGQIYSYVVFHRSFHPAFVAPYNVCVIELTEGPRILANVLDMDAGELRVGWLVRAVFDDDWPALIRFRRWVPEDYVPPAHVLPTNAVRTQG